MVGPDGHVPVAASLGGVGEHPVDDGRTQNAPFSHGPGKGFQIVQDAPHRVDVRLDFRKGAPAEGSAL